jgi:putative alpha-1,2-mannosidase
LPITKTWALFPLEREGNSVSKTVEYAYDDWCIAEMAKSLGNMDDYEIFYSQGAELPQCF